VGCGKQESQQATPPPECAGVACKLSVEEAKAGEVYAKFKYQKVGSCEDGSRRFSWLTLANRVVIANTIDHNDIVADLQLFLNDDGSYTGVYQEKTQKRVEMGFWQTVEINNKQDLKGTWGTQKNQIMIEGLGLGSAVTARGWPGIQFPVAEDTKAFGSLAGHKVNLITTRSNVSKDGQTVEQACAEEKAQAEVKK
jgi:hypothetical protein